MRRHGTAEHVDQFEVLGDRALAAGSWPLIRLCGYEFSAILNKPEHRFRQPFDPRFGKMMVKTASFVLTQPDLDGAYGYAEHGELSLLLRRAGHERSAHDLLCRVVGCASSKLSLLLGDVATFDAHLYEFPQPQLVLGYFRWRQHAAIGHTLDGHCAHSLVRSGADPVGVPKLLAGMGLDEKIEILANNEIDYAELPIWQRRGTGIIVRADGAPGDAARLLVDTNLPEEEAYATYLRPILS
jgi:tRNA(His) 5'-end guanylyltransferase